MALELTEDQARIVVEPFLERYRTAVLSGNVEALSACFGTPGLVVADGDVIPLDSETAAAEAFAAAAAQYRSQGMTDARPVIDRLEINSRLLLTADVTWTYFGSTGAVLATERFKYILRLQLDGPRIHTVVARTV